MCLPERLSGNKTGERSSDNKIGDVADWSGLLPELVVEIAIRLPTVEDVMAFRGVCTSWRRAGLRKIKAGLAHLLLLSEKDGSDERELYSISKRKIIMRISLPEAKGKRCLEARFGWLVTVDDSGDVALLNPISRANIKLPNFTAFPNYNEYYRCNPTAHIIQRAMLSDNPSNYSSDFVLVVIGAHFLGFWRPGPGDERWTWVGGSLFKLVLNIPRPQFENLGCCKDKLYAVDWSGGVWVLDPDRTDDDRTAARLITMVPGHLVSCKGLYLVGSSDGELILVTRDDKSSQLKYGVKIFELFHIDVIKGEWKVISSLDKDAIFIGYNTPCCVPASPSDVIKPNCIYFSDDCSLINNFTGECGRDMGVYNIEDRSIERFSVESLCPFPQCPPLWMDSSIILNY